MVHCCKIFAWLAFFLLLALTPAKPVEVRVLSYSINHGKNYWAESNIREILYLIRQTAPDLIALQEIDSLAENGRVSFQLRQLAVQTGYHYVYGASGKVENGTYGVGILSKWPLENTQKLTMPHTAGYDPRVMVCGLVSPVKGRYFRLCTARLEYASLFDRSLQSAFIHQVLSPSVQPVLLAVDMGARPQDQPYGYFGEGWIDAAGDSPVSTWTQGQSGDRLDYLFGLKSTRVRVKSYQVMQDHASTSDHFPILATFELW